MNGTMFSKVFIPVFVTLFTYGSSWVGSTPNSGSGVWSTPGNASGVGGSSAPGNDSWVKRGLPLPPPLAGPHPWDVLSSTLQQTQALTDASPEPGKSAASPGSAELRRASESPTVLYTHGSASSAVHHAAVSASPLGPLYHSGPIGQVQALPTVPPTVYAIFHHHRPLTDTSPPSPPPSTPITTVATFLPHFALVPVALIVGHGEGHAQRGVVQPQSSGRLPPPAKAQNQEGAEKPSTYEQSPETPEEKSSLGPLSSGPPAPHAGALRLNTGKLSLRSAPVSDLPQGAFNDSIVFPVTSPTSPSVATQATSDDRVVYPDALSTPSSAESQATPSDTVVFPANSTTPSAETIIFPSGTTTPLSSSATPTPPPPPPATTHDPISTTSGDVDTNDKVSIIVPPRPCPGPCEVANGGVCVVDLLCQERHTNVP